MKLEIASQLARDLESVHPKSPMIQIFRGLRFLEANDTEQVCTLACEWKDSLGTEANLPCSL